MEKIKFNNILERDNIANEIKNTLIHFEKNKKDLTTKRGIYIYGSPGSGKTTFIKNILNDLNYDTISYDAGDIRNKVIIENITKCKMSDKNVLSLFNTKSKPIAKETKKSGKCIKFFNIYNRYI